MLTAASYPLFDEEDLRNRVRDGDYLTDRGSSTPRMPVAIGCPTLLFNGLTLSLSQASSPPSWVLVLSPLLECVTAQLPHFVTVPTKPKFPPKSSLPPLETPYRKT